MQTTTPQLVLVTFAMVSTGALSSINLHTTSLMDPNSNHHNQLIAMSVKS